MMGITGVCFALSNANAPLELDGNWDKLGVDTLWTQWSILRDGLIWVDFSPWSPTAPAFWAQVLKTDVNARPAWAKKMVIGLAGDNINPATEHELHELVQHSLEFVRNFAERRKHYRPAGWYLPLEVNPSWHPGSCDIARAALTDLQSLGETPVWVSTFSGAYEPLCPESFADWVLGWLPKGIGLLLHDGVGAVPRPASEARVYVDALAGRLANRNELIVDVECFRGEPPVQVGADELAKQIRAYEGKYELYLFDCGKLEPARVDSLQGLLAR